MALFEVNPGSFGSAGEYSNFVDQYNSLDPQGRYQLIQEQFPNDAATLQYFYNNFGGDNLFKDRLNEPSRENAFMSFIDNILTQNRTYAREQYMQGLDHNFSAKEAEKAFERELGAANTQFQRQAKDLIDAGFNPALALSYGGASVPHSAFGSTGSHGHHEDSSTGMRLLSTMLSLVGAVAVGAIRASTAASAQATSQNYLASKLLSNSALGVAAKVASTDYSYKRPSVYSKSVGNGRFVSTSPMFD